MTQYSILLVILAAALSSTPARGQDSATRALSPEDLFAARTLVFGSAVRVSRDGRYVAYVTWDPQGRLTDGELRQRPGQWYLFPGGLPSGFGPGAEVWVLDLETRETIKVGGDGANAWAPVWSPREPRLVFLSDRGGAPGLWEWRPARALRRVTRRLLTTDYYGASGAMAWMPDGRSIVLATAPVEALRQVPAPHRAGRVAPRAQPDSLTVEVRRAGPVSGQPASDSSPANVRPPSAAEYEIVAVDVETGAVRPLGRDSDVHWLEPSPDGRLVAYAAMRDRSKPGGMRYQTYYDVLVRPFHGSGAPRTLCRQVPISFFGRNVVRWAPDSRALLYATTGLEQQQGFFKIGVDDSVAIPLLPFSPKLRQLSGAVWSALSDAIYGWGGESVWAYDPRTGQGREVAHLAGKRVSYVLTTGTGGPATLLEPQVLVALASDSSGGVWGFYRVELRSGQVRPLYEAQQAIAAGGFEAENTVAVEAHAGRVVFAAEAASQPEELWLTDLSFRAPKPISRLSGRVGDIRLGERRVVTWTDADGTRRSGILLLPSGYRPDVRYPLILWVYEQAVPYSVNTFGLAGQTAFNLHLFTTRGYAAFYPDVRWIPDSVMPGLGRQVASAVRELAREGVVDSTRVGVVGQSSGGYDVLAIAATYPGLRAGVVVNGVSDMVLMWGSTLDNSIGQEWVEQQMALGAPPWERPQNYVRNSPSFHFDDVRAALLLVAGTADSFTIRHMDLAYLGLKRSAKEVEYRRYRGEGHVPDHWSPVNRGDVTKRIIEWFDQHLKR